MLELKGREWTDSGFKVFNENSMSSIKRNKTSIKKKV